MTARTAINRKLAAIAETNGIPIASPAINDLPEEAPQGFAYLLAIHPYFPSDTMEFPSFHQTINIARLYAYHADRSAHQDCHDASGKPTTPTDSAIEDYHKGMYAPQGCGETTSNGEPCIYPRTNPHVYVVRWESLASGCRIPDDIFNDAINSILINPLRN